MSGADFLDTCVLVYAYMFDDPPKQKIAQELVEKGVAGKCVISSQVLAEFAAVLLHKVSRPAASDAVITILNRLSPIKSIVPDPDLIRRAVEAHSAYGLHFYDGLIIAAAERAGCSRIWSEDFNSGQEYFGVTAANPFV
jgi:predicted nucleic acid-binding protein